MASQNRGLGSQGRQALGRAGETWAALAELHPQAQNPASLSQQSVAPESPPDNWRSFDSTRVAEAAYDSREGRLYVRWVKPGPSYVYEGVSANEWRNFRRAKSAGKYVNRVLNGHDYHSGRF